MPSIDIIVVILVTSIIQSILGVGVLLIGTPILILLGYPYFDVLSLTLPTSFAISLSQIIKLNSSIDMSFVKMALLFTIPMIPLGMFISKYFGTWIGAVVGLYLIIISFNKIMNILLPLNASWNRQKLVFFVLGLVHGVTNLGGAILPSLVNQKNREKEEKLGTVATVYFSFAFIQILFLLVFESTIEKNFTRTGICLFTGLIGYLVIGQWLFKSINTEKYSRFLKLYTFTLGVILILVKLYNKVMI